MIVPVVNAFRTGTLDISIDKGNDTVPSNDEYDFLGDTANNAIQLEHNLAPSPPDEDGNGSKETLIIQATNPTLQANENGIRPYVKVSRLR